MKRILSILMLLALLFSLASCSQENPGDTILLYYPRNNITYGESNGVLYPERRNASLYSGNNMDTFIATYIQGPVSAELSNPFPDDLELLLSARNEGELHLTFSDALSSLSDLELILACSCLTKTLLPLAGVTQIHFRCDDAMLLGKDTLIMDENGIMTVDTITPDSTTTS